MRVPVSWLRSLLPGLTAPVQDLSAALIRAGFEVEGVHRVGEDVSGVVVGRVLDVEELTGFKKPIRFCHVDVGARVHEVVCGAQNFAVGDLVPFAVPGAVLPGDFRIAARQTYGHTSDGMICSAAELGLPGDPSGILVLADRDLGLDAGLELGRDVVAALGLRDIVLDVAVGYDRGYCLSMRGLAREVATAFGLTYDDPGLVTDQHALGGSASDGGCEGQPGQRGHRVRVEDGCDRFVLATVTGLDPSAPSPTWLQRRLVLAGMRPISLAVDVTNHVMLELGQPLHAYDAATVTGPIVVRRATTGERLTTLDGTDRALTVADLVIADDSGPIGLAGVMGGLATEITAGTRDVLVEAARFDPVLIARGARRHRLPSEASKRFERGVDPGLAPVAAHAAADLLVRLGGAVVGPVTDVDRRVEAPSITLSVGFSGRVAGRAYAPEVVIARLQDVGCDVNGTDPLQVRPPSWRPDLTGTSELAEEVIRLEGYETLPVVLPPAPAGRGLSAERRLRRTASRALAAAGLVEVTTPPFVGAQVLQAIGGGTTAPALVNPLSAEESLMRPSLLPGLLKALDRNVRRGLADVAVFETGHVFLGAGSTASSPGVVGAPTDAERAALDAALPDQPSYAGLVLCGAGASWDRAVETVLLLGRALGVMLEVRAGAAGAFHPGRCAQVLHHGTSVGLAGELHPRVVTALGLPARTCAAEVDLDALVAAAVAGGEVKAPRVSSYPPATVDVALVVDMPTPAALVEAALRNGAGELLEELHLFDVYTGPQVGEGRRSLAYALRLRAPDRTLTDVEVLGARDAAVAEAGARTGAVLRS